MSNTPAKRQMSSATLEGVQIIFRNFAGNEGQYNRAGERNFAVALDPEVAEAMAADGWNVKYSKQREDEDQPRAYLPVAVNYRGPRPPKVVFVKSNGKLTIPEEMLEIVDWADIEHVDLILNPYQWDVNGNTGIKAYLKSAYIVIREDELELRYRDIPEIDMQGNMLALESGQDALFTQHGDEVEVEEIYDGELEG